MEPISNFSCFLNDCLQENEVKVLLINQTPNGASEKQILCFQSPIFADEFSFCIYDLINFLKLNWQELVNSMIFWFDFERKCYIYLGNDPLPSDMWIMFNKEYGKKIIIKYRQKAEVSLQNTLEEISPKNNEKSDNAYIKKIKQGPRAFERKIGYAIKKVALWRKLYHGINLSGSNVQMSLKIAANKIHIPKKTLDDYFVQIRLGKKYGFNFNDNNEEKMGFLRKFNKKAISKENEEQLLFPTESKYPQVL